MSTSNRRPKGRKQRRAALALATTALTHLSDMTVPQLQAVLFELQVPRTEWARLRKAELVARVQRELDAHPRVDQALCQREITSAGGGSNHNHNKTRVACRFSRLSTNLILHVAGFLDVRALACWAGCNAFARLRLTMALSGTPSPALHALSTLHWQKGKATTLKLLLSRTASLRRLSLKNCDFADYILPSVRLLALEHFELCRMGHLNVADVLAALRSCQSLVALRISVLHATLADLTPNYYHWPRLRRLRLEGMNSDWVWFQQLVVLVVCLCVFVCMDRVG